MGVWGPHLYDNDIAMDVRDEFESELDSGKTAEEAFAAIITSNRPAKYTELDSIFFWTALADTLCDFNIYNSQIIEKVKNLICSSREMDAWGVYSLSFVQSYKKELEKLYTKLINWEGHKTEKEKKGSFEWHIGDVFCYRIDKPESENRFTYPYMMIYVADLYEWADGQLIPIVYLKPSDGIISNISGFDDLGFIQTASTRYEERFWPIDGRDPQTDIQRKSEIKYIRDEYGFLPQYRIKLLLTKKFVKQNLVFVCNFSSIKTPVNEFIPHHKLNIRTLSYKELPNAFIKLYHLFNLKECEIYKVSADYLNKECFDC